MPAKCQTRAQRHPLTPTRPCTEVLSTYCSVYISFLLVFISELGGFYNVSMAAQLRHWQFRCASTGTSACEITSMFNKGNTKYASQTFRLGTVSSQKRRIAVSTQHGRVQTPWRRMAVCGSRTCTSIKCTPQIGRLHWFGLLLHVSNTKKGDLSKG
ncbi:hypothetical protein PAXRUDRAFT_440359 [Paxillus rubicundulus Ve08.2h10]|uniref:Unplaced genomic scaffold scaffold_275, whole genome shotgun sequence n=1 Tax=Paxillus rubicundulus Ve08.2h10 TaxID=930991 RepID=A0A0D0E835_9AGAM|nr:hypothetical protein PAXRUDRAFT_440359 [Paxillus rubicundulus Ve08.2h10]